MSSYFHIKKSKKFIVKELFKDFSKIIKRHFHKKTANLDLLDIGCASGELLYFLKKDLRTDRLVWGLDISKDLINNARERFGNSSIKFFVANANNFKLNKKFSVITAASLISYFDDPYPILKNMLKYLKPDGILLISGVFNNRNIDVRLRYKLENDKKWKNDAALNQFSIRTIKDFFAEHGYQCKISTQIMPFNISPKKHPIRSWTVNLNGKRYVMNGLQLVYNIQTLAITKK